MNSYIWEPEIIYKKDNKMPRNGQSNNPPILSEARMERVLTSIFNQDEIEESAELNKWASLGNDVYTSTYSTISKLPPGFYESKYEHSGRLIIQRRELKVDELIPLPNITTNILNNIRKFWKSKEKFEKFGQVYSRAILLHGDPGHGKTACINLLSQELIKNGGIVYNALSFAITKETISTIRAIEKERPIICIMEDIDGIIDDEGEQSVLSLLDGEHKFSDITYIATTNYPEKIDKRIINRPSRFDEIIKINAPDETVRKTYIEKCLGKTGQLDIDIDKWVKDTKELSLAHIKELFVSVYCLDNSYKESLERIKGMKKLPKSTDDNKLGF